MNNSVISDVAIVKRSIMAKYCPSEILKTSLFAGLTLDSVLKLTGKLSVTKKKTTETTETKEVSETETITQEIITKPGQINCVVLLMTRAEIKVPYTMTAVTKEGKKIEAKGVLEGVIHKDFHLSIEGGELKTKKKCDWE